MCRPLAVASYNALYETALEANPLDAYLLLAVSDICIQHTTAVRKKFLFPAPSFVDLKRKFKEFS